MSPIGHLAVGLAAKRVAPKAPLGVLLLAAWVIDVLFFIFLFVGIENMQFDPWSHGLFMAAVWSVSAALLTSRIYRDNRTGLVIGLLVFSHWVLDFISWDTLPLFFGGSPELGLGLYNSLSDPRKIVVELVLFVPGTVVYILTRNRLARQKKAADGGGKVMAH